MKTSLLIFGGTKIQFSYGQKVRVTQDGQHVESIHDLKSFRKWAKELLTDNQKKLVNANLRAVK